MKKVIVTATVLLVLGTTWMLYLEYKNRRFIESLPNPPSTVRQPVDTIEVPSTDENSDIVPMEFTPSETAVRDTDPESEHTRPHPHPHVSEPTETSENPFEALTLDDIIDDILKDSTEDIVLENQELSATEIEERRKATETINRVMMNPDNWIQGNPGEVGFTFALSKEDNEAFLKANALLMPPQANRQALERLRNPDTPPNPIRPQETDFFIEFKGMKIYFPAGFPLAY